MSAENIHAVRQVNWKELIQPEGDIKNNKYLNPQKSLDTMIFNGSECELKEFYDDSIATTLQHCLKEGYRPLFMPELVELKIQGKARWDALYHTSSIVVTGRDKEGKAVYVYAHIHNYFSKPENITTAISKGLQNGAGKMPKGLFHKLIDLEDGKNVFVIPYDVLNKSEKVVSLDKAMAHPQTIPFFGGKDIAERYLAMFHEHHGGLPFQISHSDMLDGYTPRASLLYCTIGHACNISLNGAADFLGIRESKRK